MIARDRCKGQLEIDVDDTDRQMDRQISNSMVINYKLIRIINVQQAYM